MDSITVRLTDEMVESLDSDADDRGVSRSEYIRDTLDARHDPPPDTETDERDTERIRELEDEIEKLEQEITRLNRERRQLLEQRDEHTDLVRAVEDQRTLERQRAEAGVLTRVKWWFRGMD